MKYIIFLYSQVYISYGPAMNKRPARKFIELSGKCSKEGYAYGQCVLGCYSTIGKDSCAAEFMKFKECMIKVAGKKW
ncbi:uncharacterized protein PRCAT00004857001 [Priceomyces carsonii]|uniref:uncharacterized protein n=1 Tax=Priceomyces carsonii TaxID=28549 RepID=UPI002ED873FC|nr:unnamed protein product [Priceomyces carsonii]